MGFNPRDHLTLQCLRPKALPPFRVKSPQGLTCDEQRQPGKQVRYVFVSLSLLRWQHSVGLVPTLECEIVSMEIIQKGWYSGELLVKEEISDLLTE